jgi:PAS domain S-box-containing protein
LNKYPQVLIVDDSEDDTQLLLGELCKNGYEPYHVRVDTAEAMKIAIEEHEWDIVLSSCIMLEFSGLAALEILKETGLDLPFILVSRKIDEETAVQLMRAGAHDYFEKGSLKRLVPALERELQKAEDRQQRKNAENLLRKSEERFRLITETIEEVFWIVDSEIERMLYISPGFERIWGYPRKSLYANPLSFIDAVHPDDRHQMFSTLKLQKIGQPYDHEYRIIRPDGAVRWIWDHGYPVRSETGHLSCYVGVAQDITDHKLAEEALKESEEKMRSLTETAADAIMMIDENGAIAYWNPAAERIFGYPAAEVMGKSLTFLLAPERIHYTFLTGFACYIATGCGPEWEKTLEMEAVKKDGTVIPVEVSFSVMFLKDKKHAIGIIRDITERKRAEQELADSYQFSRQIIESVDAGVIVLGADSRFRVWNPYMEKLTGLSLKEVQGKHPEELFPFLRETGINERIEKTLAGQTPDPLDMPYHYPASGRSGWLWETNAPMRNTKGEIIGVITTVRDITERKQAEQELRDTQFSVDNAAVPIFWILEGGRFCYANDACCYLGYSRDELLQMTVYDIDPLFSREGELKNLETLREKGSMTFESLHRTKTGDLKPVEITLNNMERAGILFHVAYVRDISERKTAEARIARSEQKFRAIFESAHDAIFLIAGDSSYVDCNPAATELFRCAKEDLLVKNPQFFSPPVQPDGFNTMDKAREIIADALQGKPQCFEWRHRRSDGSEFDSVVVLSRFELDGEPMLVAIVRDISHRKSLEDQLHHAQKLEAVGQLAGGVAHDFNNMLTAIIGFTGLISMKIQANDPSRKYVEQIMAASKRAAELTQGLLSFSRKEIMTPKTVDLNDIIVMLEKMLSRLIRESIELRVDTSPVVLNVIADRGKTEQVIMNLVTNAGDSIKDVGVITINTYTFEMDNEFIQLHGFGKTGNYACITVSDTGCGMCEATKRRIFDPFFTTKETGKGTGLGLSIVYGIIKQHNGYIRVKSEPDKGTTFYIYLPLAGSSSETDHSVLSAPSNAFQGNESLLLAEDDVTVNHLHKVLLEEAGYTVITAADGTEALDKFREHEDKIALLILDVVMPKMSGKGVLELIKQVNPGIKALFVSGYPADVLSNAGMVQNDIEILMKPVSPNELLCKIRNMLDCGLI